MIAEAVTVAALRVSVSPERFRMGPRSSVVLAVRNAGRTGIRVSLDAAGYGLDLHGRPLIRERVSAWVRVRPRAILVPPRGTASVRVTARVPAKATPGDHSFVVLASVDDAVRRTSRVLVRVGVVAVIRVPGAVHRSLVIPSPPAVTGRRLRLVVLNRGNVEEWLARGALDVALRRGSRTVAVLRSHGRRVLARGRAVFEWNLPAGLHGAITARVALGRRSYRLRL